ncbi:MAG: 16S rRNA (guanine(966)-N(2))-methyltransferase RsmD [Chromatiales bacterium]|nr:16S rRNA (guanine(966)-N(2))-methyltransferase RsmD [Chromatiales bacterium]
MKPTRDSNVGKIRIIGGRWRGRLLPVPSSDGLRPTAGRIRETLFNWLTPWVRDARCLDLFAGTGALGLESLSRGAAHVTLVEKDVTLVATLRESVDRLDAVTSADVVRMDALQWLATATPVPHDVVFVDPPFASGLLEPALGALQGTGWLSETAKIYVETSAEGLDDAGFVRHWQIEKARNAGQVRYYLFSAT